jgi:zinc-ribbon family
MQPMIIWGYRSRSKTLGQRPVSCPNCHQTAMTGFGQSRRWFTIFFIPIFPISGSTTVASCGLCGYRYKVDQQVSKQMFP